MRRVEPLNSFPLTQIRNVPLVDLSCRVGEGLSAKNRVGEQGKSN